MDFDVNVWLDLTEKPVKLILMNVAQILVNMKEPANSGKIHTNASVEMVLRARIVKGISMTVLKIPA